MMSNNMTEDEMVLDADDNNDIDDTINWKKDLLGFLVYVLIIVLLVWTVNTFIGQRTSVDGESMENTLEDEDNLWIDKLHYRLHDPERFDIVVLAIYDSDYYEDDEEYEGKDYLDAYYIKRIIGLPGETVRIDTDGNIYINDELIVEDYGKEIIEPENIGRAYTDIKLGEDEYFVMGDNRNNSEDSRGSIVGNVKRDRFIGKAVFRLWPLNKLGRIE